MKVLVAIASHGFGNQKYAEQLLAEYSGMSFDVDIAVISNVPKEFDPRFGKIEILVGAPIKDPWSLPFRHREFFAERIDAYDVFIYTEDDTLLTEQHVRSFLAATEVLQPDEIAGFTMEAVGR